MREWDRLLSMNEKKTQGEDGLFIGAVAACLFGLGFLFRTTGIASSYLRLWPLSLPMAGALILFYEVSRGRKRPVLFAGALFFLGFGVLALIAGFLRLRASHLWPILMVIVGLDWLVTGRRFRGRWIVSFLVPSLSFTLLGLVFSLFSFNVVGMSFGKFMGTWWPSILIAGGIVLFAAYGLSRHGQKGPPEGP